MGKKKVNAKRVLTPKDIEELPDCYYDDFQPCPDLPKEEDREACVRCVIGTARKACVDDNPGRAMSELRTLELILWKAGILTEEKDEDQ